MKKLSNIQIFVLVIVLLLSFLLRYHNHIYIPKRGETSDEYAFAFQGVSLLTKGYPIAWSAIPIYPEKNRSNLTIDGIYFPIVHPYLDHPPFFGILSGTLALLKNQSTFELIQLSTIRKLPLILSLVSTLLTFLIAKKLYGFKLGIWSTLVFSTGIVYVLNMRLNVAETLITPILLFSIYLLIRTKKTISWHKIIYLSILSVLAILTKILGIIVFITVIYFLLFESKVTKQQIVTFIFLFLLGVMVLFFYGVSFGGEFFWQIQSYQGARLLGAETFFTLLTKPLIVNTIFYDSWYYLGIFSIVIFSIKYKEHKYIIIPSVFYILLMILSVTKTDLHAWYTIPLFPFMAIASAQILNQISKKLNWSSIFLVLLLGMFYSSYIFEKQLDLTTLGFRILLLVLLLPLIIALLTKKKTLFSLFLNIYFYLFILGNIYILLNFT